jgi:Ca2+-transporting ATPase
VGTQIIWIGILMGAISLAIGYGFWLEDPDGVWQTMVFVTLVLSQMGNALATRSNRESIFSIGLFTNRLMVGAVLLTVVLQMMLIYVPFLQKIFNTVALSAGELAIALVASAVVFAAVETYKWNLRRLDKTGQI